jgi:hypothetical protein
MLSLPKKIKEMLNEEMKKWTCPTMNTIL